MSFYDDASLVLIPSGTKTSKVYSQKPTNGSGDFTFARASSATRTNSAGLIEEVRTNLLLQSNTFSNASWVKDGTTLTGGQAGYDGTNNAWLLDKIANQFRFINQLVTISGTYVFSVYAKANTLDKITLRDSSSQAVEFNLSTGTIVSQVNGAVGRIVSVGGGWYRCSVVMTTTNPSPQIYPDWNGSTAGNILIQNAQVETGDVASDYIPTTTAAVTVGPTNNVPRLDYSGGATCPRLLLEPQRTNLILQSEAFDNASWTKALSTITANTTTSPDGTANADTLLADGTSGIHATWNTVTVTSGTTYTYTIYAKKGTNDFLQLYWGVVLFGSNAWVNFNLNTGTVGSIGSAATASIQSVGNGWYRLITTATATTSGLNQIVGNNIITSATSPRAESNTLSTSVFLWGAQAEVGSFATSYIPTTTAAVTRLADAARTASGVTSIFNSTWTAFGEVVIPARGSTGTAAGYGLRSVYGSTASANWPFFIIHGATTSTVDFQWVVSGSVAKTANVAITYGTRFKFAATSDGTLYINGTLSSASSSLTPATPVEFGLGRLGQSDFSAGESAAHNQAVLFKTALTNAQLAELTTL